MMTPQEQLDLLHYLDKLDGHLSSFCGICGKIFTVQMSPNTSNLIADKTRRRLKELVDDCNHITSDK